MSANRCSIIGQQVELDDLPLQGTGSAFVGYEQPSVASAQPAHQDRGRHGHSSRDSDSKQQQSSQQARAYQPAEPRAANPRRPSQRRRKPAPLSTSAANAAAVPAVVQTLPHDRHRRMLQSMSTGDDESKQEQQRKHSQTYMEPLKTVRQGGFATPRSGAGLGPRSPRLQAPGAAPSPRRGRVYVPAAPLTSTAAGERKSRHRPVVPPLPLKTLGNAAGAGAPSPRTRRFVFPSPSSSDGVPSFSNSKDGSAASSGANSGANSGRGSAQHSGRSSGRRHSPRSSAASGPGISMPHGSTSQAGEPRRRKAVAGMQWAQPKNEKLAAAAHGYERNAKAREYLKTGLTARLSGNPEAQQAMQSANPRHYGVPVPTAREEARRRSRSSSKDAEASDDEDSKEHILEPLHRQPNSQHARAPRAVRVMRNRRRSPRGIYATLARNNSSAAYDPLQAQSQPQPYASGGRPPVAMLSTTITPLDVQAPKLDTGPSAGRPSSGSTTPYISTDAPQATGSASAASSASTIPDAPRRRSGGTTPSMRLAPLRTGAAATTPTAAGMAREEKEAPTNKLLGAGMQLTRTVHSPTDASADLLWSSKPRSIVVSSKPAGYATARGSKTTPTHRAAVRKVHSMPGVSAIRALDSSNVQSNIRRLESMPAHYEAQSALTAMGNLSDDEDRRSVGIGMGLGSDSDDDGGDSDAVSVNSTEAVVGKDGPVGLAPMRAGGLPGLGKVAELKEREAELVARPSPSARSGRRRLAPAPKFDSARAHLPQQEIRQPDVLSQVPL